MNQESIDNLVKALKELNFQEAERIATQIEPTSLGRIFHELAEEQIGLLGYTFAAEMAHKHQSSLWHRVSATIVTESLSHLSHGHEAGLYHILKAIEIEPNNWHLKEFALVYYKDKIMAKAIAEDFAREVLKHDSTNKTALNIMME